MAAGLGFKTFAVGEILSAANVNGYLMQGVLVFANSTARDAAITSPQEGQFAYLKDTNVTTYYTGSAWANLDTTGMTNPMTTTGDTIYSSSGSTPARLGIGSTGNVLTVAGGVPTWAAPASGGGMTLLSTTTLSGASTTISSIDQTYVDLVVYISGTNCATAGQPNVQVNSQTTGSYGVQNNNSNGSSTTNLITNSQVTVYSLQNSNAANDANNFASLIILNYASSTTYKGFNSLSSAKIASTFDTAITAGVIRDTTAITSLKFQSAGGAGWSAGTVLIYGVK